jgi:hypothetical protein
VHDRIVCVSLESDLAMMSRDPLIKGVMQKQVGQQRGDHSPAPSQPKHDQTQERGMSMGF